MPKPPSKKVAKLLKLANKLESEENEKPSRKRHKPDLKRTTRKLKPKPARIIAYDFETTRIEPGTPRPLYITACGEDMHYASAITDMAHLRLILLNNFLIPEHSGTKFVAWAGNNFDAYFIAAALLDTPRYMIRPFLTRSNQLRGLMVFDTETSDEWQFTDGMAMLGLVGVSLKKFLESFAPDLPKLSGVINFETEEFDSNNPAHCEYAMRDSVGLYHAMIRAQQILVERFDEPLRMTMGAACIRILKANIPQDVVIRPMPDDLADVVDYYVMRGGFCYCVRPYHGPIWKYDLNQAYAAAMREAQLPCGQAAHVKSSARPPKLLPYIARLTASKPGNIVPIFHRTIIGNGNGPRAAWSLGEIPDTWLVASEVEQLLSEGWRVRFKEHYFWNDGFNLRDYVDKLERGRMTCEGGPSGPIGIMYKMVGNHSYGKTLETLDSIEYIVSSTCPPGYLEYCGDGTEPFKHLFFKCETPREKDYQKPQIGAFITAYVRMVVRRAALIDPKHWLYADTDCVIFSADVSESLDIDPKRYGAWKIEESGALYKIIAKKVYAQDAAPGIDKPKVSAKGMNVRKLSPDDFDKWFDGHPPAQAQVQRHNFLMAMQGSEMYRAQLRHGTAVHIDPLPSSDPVSSQVTIE